MTLNLENQNHKFNKMRGREAQRKDEKSKERKIYRKII